MREGFMNIHALEFFSESNCGNHFQLS